MSGFYKFISSHGVKKGMVRYSKGGRDYVSYGWFYTSPFYYSKIKPHKIFFRLVDVDKMIKRIKQDDDKLNNWKARFGKIPLPS